MEVYIEYVILDNLIINCIIFYLTSLTLKLHAKKRWIFFASVLGTAFSICLPLITLNSWILIAVKFAGGFILCLFLVRYKSLLQLIITYLLFLSYTFVLGGMCFGILYMFNGTLTITNFLIGGTDIPIGVVVGAMFLYGYLLVQMVRFYIKRRNVDKFKYRVTMHGNKQKVKLDAFLDSGNMIYDQNKPVMVINYKAFNKLFKEIPFEKVVFNKVEEADLKGARYITVGSVSGKTKMLVFTVEKIEIECGKAVKRLNDVSVGLSVKRFKNNFDLILHPELF